MKGKCVLAIHDISCIGRCSLTVALPIISAAGITCVPLPTAILSTHTGGFNEYTYRDLTCDLHPIIEHWNKLDYPFDAIYTGFLGSFEQVSIVSEIFGRYHDALKIVDPVMADEGVLYKTFDTSFPMEMRKICEKADVLIPNITEATMILGEEYIKGPYTPEYIENLMKRLVGIGAKKIVLTGVFFEDEKLGVATYDSMDGDTSFYFSDKIPGYYHGTGDVFGSAIVSALLNDHSLADSAKIAVDFTVESIKRTYSRKSDVRYGVDFEEGIPQLLDDIFDDDIPETVSELAYTIWNEHYDGIISKEQIDYMLSTYHSYEAIQKEIEEGYRFIIISDNGKKAGYLSYHDEGDALYISKAYLLKESRGKGLGRKMIDIASDYAKKHNIRRMYLRVNRNNPTVEIYKKLGFNIVSSDIADIGNGFVMDDYIMEKLV